MSAASPPLSTISSSVPTVEDLRIRLCYICREEEEHDMPSAKRWVHPCSCTLIAHEACLLEWIKSAQESRDRSKNALKCPQCGSGYVLESNNPLILRVLNAVNNAISRAGTVITVASFSGIVLTCAGGVYIVLASYGGIALKEYLGRDYFAFALSNDSSSWSWSTWLSLPLIPISLILSRLPLASPAPTVPSTMLLLWSAVFPTPDVIVPSFLGMPATGYKAIHAKRDGSSQHLASVPTQVASYFSAFGVLRHASIWPLTPAPLWPPSPTLICLCYPLIYSLYQKARDSLFQYVTDSKTPLSFPLRPQRLIWAAGGDGAHFNVVLQNRNQPNVQQEDGAPAGGNGENNGEAAERTIRITGGSIGRLLGGALVTPYVASFFGNILLSLSHRSRVLRIILAVKNDAVPKAYQWEVGLGPKDGGLVGAISRAAHREGLPSPGLWGSLRVVLRLLTFGHRAWIESDPVWWRNGLGLGLFIVLKDIVKLIHLRLSKQELESRHLKDRDFSGINPKELDLVHPWPAAGANITVAN